MLYIARGPKHLVRFEGIRQVMAVVFSIVLVPSGKLGLRLYACRFVEQVVLSIAAGEAVEAVGAFGGVVAQQGPVPQGLPGGARGRESLDQGREGAGAAQDA